MDFVVLSSSRGTTFEAVLRAREAGSLQATCLGLVTDRADRGCILKARKEQLPVEIVERKGGEERESYDRRLQERILVMLRRPEASQGDMLLACMGWMWVFSPWFVREFRGRILNIHPALLPKHPGRNAHEEVLAAGEKESGMTIHWIDEGIDTGPVVLQKRCPVLPGDTVDTLKERVQALEKEWYPKVLQGLHEQSKA